MCEDAQERADLGTISAASVIEVADEAILAIKGEDGTASVHVPEDMLEPFEDTVNEVGIVYGRDEDEAALIGDGGTVVADEEVTHRVQKAREQLTTLQEKAGPAYPGASEVIGKVIGDLDDIEDWLTDDEEDDAAIRTDGGHPVGPDVDEVHPQTTVSTFPCDGCDELTLGEPIPVTEGGFEQFCSKRCLAETYRFLRGGLHLCDLCTQVFDCLEELADHDCRGPGQLEVRPGA